MAAWTRTTRRLRRRFFLLKSNAFGNTPQRVGGQNKQSRRAGNCYNPVNSAITPGSAAVHLNRTDCNRTAYAITPASKTSNSLTRSQQWRRTMTQLLMRTVKKGPLGRHRTTSTAYQVVVSTSLHFMTHANSLEHQEDSTTIITHVFL